MPINVHPDTKRELFALTKTLLGEPIHPVDVTDAQMEARLAVAVEKFEQFHYMGTEQLHFVHRITPTDIMRGWIETPEDITGISGALAFDRRTNADSFWWSQGPGAMTNTWFADSTYSGGHGSVDAGVGNYGITNAVTMYLNDVQRAYFENILCPEEVIRWNELTRRLFFNTSVEKLVADTYVVCEVFSSVARQQPDGLKQAMKCDWFKRYFESQVKLQWGTNLTKFTGGTLFGTNVTVNGDRILNDAKQELKDLDDELMDRWYAPPRMFVG